MTAPDGPDMLTTTGHGVAISRNLWLFDSNRRDWHGFLPSTHCVHQALMWALLLSAQLEGANTRSDNLNGVRVVFRGCLWLDSLGRDRR